MAVCNVLFNLNAISNSCAKYEHPRSKMKEWNWCNKHRLIVSTFDLAF